MISLKTIKISYFIYKRFNHLYMYVMKPKSQTINQLKSKTNKYL